MLLLIRILDESYEHKRLAIVFENVIQTAYLSLDVPKQNLDTALCKLDYDEW